MTTSDLPGSNGNRPLDDHNSSTGAVPVEDRRNARAEVVDREKARFGGIKWGSAFFGWLTATGTAVILTALLAMVGTAIGLGSTDSTDQAANAAAENAGTISLIGAILLAIAVFGSYFCGGYVAGRMARFDGAKQGIAVWVWAIIMAVIIAILGAIAGNQFDVLSNLNSVPRIPIDVEDLTTGGIITAIVIVLASLGGAILGGLAGMRFHRRVDREGLGR